MSASLGSGELPSINSLGPTGARLPCRCCCHIAPLTPRLPRTPGATKGLSDLLPHGVCFHHAGLTDAEKVRVRARLGVRVRVRVRV